VKIVVAYVPISSTTITGMGAENEKAPKDVDVTSTPWGSGKSFEL